MVTGVSVIAWAIFAREFPVQGATTIMSKRPLGPRGSAATKESTGVVPVRAVIFSRKARAVPNRVSVFATEKEKIGMTFHPASMTI
jgi:hypothetical protein